MKFANSLRYLKQRSLTSARLKLCEPKKQRKSTKCLPKRSSCTLTKVVSCANEYWGMRGAKFYCEPLSVIAR